MNQHTPDAFHEFVRLLPTPEFVKLCNDVQRRTLALSGSHAFHVKHHARALRNAMTGLCMAEMVDDMPGLEGKRRTLIHAANDELLRHG